jgi:hypothetical protein
MYVTYIDRFSCHQFDADDNGKLERVLSGFFGCCKTAESAVIFCPLTLAAWPLTHRRPRHSFFAPTKTRRKAHRLSAEISYFKLVPC